MGIEIVNPKAVHYLKREKLLEARDLVQIGGPHCNFLIKNPFRRIGGNDEFLRVIHEYNEFLMNVAPHIAINLSPKRNRVNARFDVYGSRNLSCTKPQIIMANNGRGMPEDIGFQGAVGDSFIEELPEKYAHLIKLPNVHFAKTNRFIHGSKYLNDDMAKASLIDIYRPSLYRELLFWSKPSNLDCVKNFLSSEDAKIISKHIALTTGDGFDVKGYIEANTHQVGRKRTFSQKLYQDSFEELGEIIGELVKNTSLRKKFNVFFKTKLIGQLNQFDVTNYSFIPDYRALVPFKNSQNALLPTFLDNLMPEGGEEVRETEYTKFFEEERNLIGDICIRKLGSLKPPTSAIISTSLSTCTDDNAVFTGQLEDIGVQYGSTQQSEALKEKSVDNVFSGFAEKISVTLETKNGLPVLKPSTSGDDFTHMFKFPNTRHHMNLETCEWFGMLMAKSVDLPAPPFALVPNSEDVCIKEQSPNFLDDAFDAIDAAAGFSNQMYGAEPSNAVHKEVKKEKPNYVIERFDIDSPESNRVSIGEDFASLLSMSPSNKYNVSYERIAEHVHLNSTNWEEDREYLLRILTLNMLVNNCDMHAKNLSMLRSYDKATNKLQENRLSPVYDIVAVDKSLFTGKYGRAVPKHALTMNGSQEYSYDNLMVFSKETLGLSQWQADEIITDVCKKALTASDALYRQPPELLSEGGEPVHELVSLVRFVESNFDSYFANDLSIDKDSIYGETELTDEIIDNSFSFI